LKNTQSNLFRDILFGVAVGDALGVPVEFKSREWLKDRPVEYMIGYGTHDQPPGTWSDDSALTFCLAEALIGGFDLNKIATKFVLWLTEGYWTPHGTVFDVGIATQQAISRLKKGIVPELAGGFDERDNGNGSLMRILPLIIYILDRNIEQRYQITKSVSSLTHGHIRSVIACFYYLEFARKLIQGENKFNVYKELQESIPSFLRSMSIDEDEIRIYRRLLNDDIHKTSESIQSTGYVVHTLEASIWCLLTTNSYRDAVLKAVNLGGDTDTTGAVAGGLAALLYGYKNIPGNWIAQLARKDDIENLIRRFNVD
jgi:ADP-ribosyl-[dinitrogen reductase] hydrolase